MVRTTQSGNPKPLRWVAIPALMSALFAVAVGYGVALPILPFVIERFAGTADPSAMSRHTGVFAALYTSALFLFAPSWGKLSDRLGRRLIVIVGLIGFSSSLALFSIVENLQLHYLGRFFEGLFAAAVTPAVYALIGDRAPSKEWRAYRLTFLNLAGTAGFLVGPMLGGLMLRAAPYFIGNAESNFQSPFLGTATLAFLALILILKFVPPDRPVVRRKIEPKNERGPVVRLLIIAFVTAMAIGAFEVGLVLHGKQLLAMDAYRIGMLFAECSLVMFVVQALVFSPIVKPTATRWLITPSLLILAAGLAAVPYARGNFPLLLAIIPVAATAGILSPIVTFWISMRGGGTQGTEIGLETAAASLGQTLGSAMGGFLYNLTNLPEASFTATALIVLTGVVASGRLPWMLFRLQTNAATPGARGVDIGAPADDMVGEAKTKAGKHPHEPV